MKIIVWFYVCKLSEYLRTLRISTIPFQQPGGNHQSKRDVSGDFVQVISLRSFPLSHSLSQRNLILIFMPSGKYPLCHLDEAQPKSLFLKLQCRK